MKNSNVRTVLLGLFVALTGVCLRASDPFVLTATSTDAGPPVAITASGSNLVNLFTSLVTSGSQFQALNGRSIDVSETFLGVPRAITVDANANRTSLTLGFTPINVTKTFTGTSSTDVNNQVTDYIEKDGSSIYAQFLRAIDAQSLVAVTDGNPNSATATAASSTFVNQGFTPAEDLTDGTSSGSDTGSSTATKPKVGGGFALGFNTGHFKAAGIEGDNYEADANILNIGLGDHVRLIVPFFINYLEVADAKVYGAGLNVVMPIRLITMSPANPWNWRITLIGGDSLSASEDLASGALLWEVGAANTVDFKVNPRLVLCVVDQFTEHRSIAISYGDYSFDPGVDQQITKNGLRLVTPLTRRLIGDLFVVDTRFLKAAAVRSFETIGGTLSLRAAKSFNLSLGVNYDTGSNYQAWSVGFTSAWRW